MTDAPGNPLSPYRWEAEYAGGVRISGWTGSRWLRSEEIDRTRLEALHILGLPCGPVRLPKGPGIPDEIIIGATWRASWGGPRPTRELVRYTLGCVHGAALYGAKIDATGMDHGKFPWPG